MKTTRYFDEEVLRKRPYFDPRWIELALMHPLVRETQSDGRIRCWVYVPEFGKYLRVVTLEDGETVHNAFLDRGSREELR